MLRFDKATLVLPLCMSILLIRLCNKICGQEVLQFSEFINVVSFLQDIVLLICVDLIYSIIIIIILFQ